MSDFHPEKGNDPEPALKGHEKDDGKRPKIAAEQQLRAATFGETETFVLKGLFDYKAIRVFDGDTLWAAVRDPATSRVWAICCRLLDIDAPEMPRAHADAMSEQGIQAFAARDRLVELVTNVTFKDRDDHRDTSDTPMPSLTDTQLQKKLDEKNTAIVEMGLSVLDGTDKYGRYLARLKGIDGRDVSRVLLEEGHAVPYDCGRDK